MKTYLELSKAELKDTLKILEMRYNELKSLTAVTTVFRSA